MVMTLKQNVLRVTVLALMAMAFPAGLFADAFQAKLYIPEAEVKSGRMFQLPVKIAPADHLAGMKLVLEYDPELLEFEKVEKTELSAGMMHVVNDKQPGRLVIVMAGARGVSGKDIALCNMFFNASPDVFEKQITKIQITHIELMTDTLKEIQSALSSVQISVLPAGGDNAGAGTSAASP